MHDRRFIYRSKAEIQIENKKSQYFLSP